MVGGGGGAAPHQRPPCPPFPYGPIITFTDEIYCNKNFSEDIPAEIIKIAKEEIAELIIICINSFI